MREYAQTSARFCSVTIPNVTRPCPTCEFMTRPSRNTEMWGTNGSIDPVFLVEHWTNCVPTKVSAGQGTIFSESRTVLLKAGQLDIVEDVGLASKWRFYCYTGA